MLPTLAYRPTSVARFARLPEFEQLFDDLLTRPFESWTQWAPTADFYEVHDEFVLEMEVPGFVRDEVEVTVEDSILTISGHHLAEEKEEERNFYVKERRQHRFSRSFTLPNTVNADAVKAELDNGVLFVRLPKLEEAKPRKIAVALK